ncbi:hypothetical protein Q4S45_05590 [Massilia sp. R2A-15]|nr:hypothetical protein [Massilia sp. R2A-15]WLI90592.1 hypothetical protein Q4S45_05590 [Massilia sp. R2A-15]
METGLIALMLLILWGPAVLYVGWRVVKMLNAPKVQQPQHVAADQAGQH